MTETVLFLAHTEQDGTLSRHALEALSAAKSLGGPMRAGLIGADVQAAATAIAACTEDSILAVTGPEFADSRYSTDAAAVEALARSSQASIIVAPQTSRFARCMAGVAQRINGRIDTHVTAVGEGPRINRWYYRQRMEAVLERTQRPWIILVESGIAPAWEGPAGLANVETVASAAATRTRVIGNQSPKAAQQTIRPDAQLLFVAGAGWTRKQADGKPHIDDAARLILDFINGSKASLGSSKSLVDLSGEGQDVLPFLSHLNQVGQTGSTPRHPKGLATCCHGEEPHVVGWRFIRERRAVNLDANCGWARGKADVVYVADAFAVMERVNALLTERA